MARDAESGRAWVGVLTPEGRGAVSVLRVWGPGALEVADRAFRPDRGAGLAESPPRRLRLGRVGAGLGDEVVAVVLSVDPPVVEIHSHGGPAAVSLVTEALTALGAEVESTRQSLADHSPSRLLAEAQVDLAAAVTLQPAEILLEQCQGALDAELLAVHDLIGSAPEQALARLDALLARGTLGCRLVSGWRVALAGRPNVGKSRLLNALAGYDRAIVDPTPGTTRDALTVRTAFGGWPVELWDTAGLRVAVEDVEAAGVALAKTLHAQADLVLLVLDRSEPLTDTDRDLMLSLRAAIRVANKADLPARWPTADADVVVSAQEGTGIEALVEAVARRLVPEVPPPGAGVPFRPEHLEALAEARQRLHAGDPLGARERISVMRGSD